MKNKTNKGLKFWINRLKANTRAFIKNPRQFVKEYIASFKALDTKGKIKMILLTLLALYVLRQAFILFLVVIFLIGMFGMPNPGTSSALKDVLAEDKAFEKTYAEGGNFYQNYDDIRGSM